jgi:hypothetical protein
VLLWVLVLVGQVEAASGIVNVVPRAVTVHLGRCYEESHDVFCDVLRLMASGRIGTLPVVLVFLTL